MVIITKIVIFRLGKRRKIMQKKKIKEYVLGGIALFIALFTLIGMAFNLTQIQNFKDYEKHSRYRYHENGFTMLGFKSDLIGEGNDYEWANALLGVFNLLHLLACIVAIGLVVLSFLACKNKKKVFNIVAIAIGIFFSLLYLIEGAVFSSVLKDKYGETFDTVSFVPFIIVAIFAIAYIAVAKLWVINENEETKEVRGAVPTVTGEPAEKKIDVVQIKQLKELLDMGAITQEEYDEQKREILKK